MPYYYYSTYPWVLTPSPSAPIWSTGIKYRTEQVSVDEDFIALDVDYVSQKVLRVFDQHFDEDFITNCIKAATEMAEFQTQTNIIPRRLALVADQAPSGGIFELRGHPVREVVSVNYYDSANETQTLSGSPAPWLFGASGVDLPATVQPLVGSEWPSFYTRSDAVRVEYDVGYLTAAEIPYMLRTGIELVVGELYKNRDLSNDMAQVPNVLGLHHFWPRRW